jgi:cellulose synthase/poly-beta-1,6-N-acetylglucosamine synthase-like glycosyltransferase
MINAAQVVFWSCGIACAYVYFGYPALLWVLSRLRPRPVRAGDFTPRVTFVIAAYNEERRIAEKLENTLALDYPPEAIEVLVVSNGSTDRTDEIVRACTDPRVRLIVMPRPGKMPALNEGARQAQGEILVLTDADFLLDRHTLRLLTSKFADPEVGGVCGARNTSIRRDGDATGDGEGLYARWDKWQKERESRIGSVFAADGLLYAIRRSLYVPVSDPMQADDMAISMQIPLQGFRLLFEPAATAYEKAVVHAREEFRRKIRITGHSVSALLKLGWPLVTSGFYSVELVSHKLARHFVPFFLIPLYAASLVLAAASGATGTMGLLYTAAFLIQTALYPLAIAGAILRDRPAGRRRILAVPYYFCFVNAAALLGILSMLRKHEVTAWSREEASIEAPDASRITPR